MIKRSFNPRFRSPILSEIKTTTIRDNPWPVGVPIMAFEWSGKPYRSKQSDIAPVIVEDVQPITIRHTLDGMRYSISFVGKKILWKTEGFDSGDEMDSWFRPLIKPGQTVTKFLMRFRLLERGEG